MRGGHNTKGKTEADGLRQISTHMLKEYGYFAGRSSGLITWTSGLAEIKSSVRVEVSKLDDGGYLRIRYTRTNYDTGELKEFDYKILLTTTPCQYGGRRYWFICPWHKNGKYCGRRVGTLYLDDDYFACRYCCNLTYTSRNAGPRDAGFVSIPDLEAQRAKVKRTHYAGRLTKQYKKMLKMEERFWASFIEGAKRLGIDPKI